MNIGKLIVTLILALNFSVAIACECGGNFVDADARVESFVQENLNDSVEELELVRAFPLFVDRMYIRRNGADSCVVEDLEGNQTFMCANRQRFNYEVNTTNNGCVVLNVRVNHRRDRSRISITDLKCKHI